MYYYVLLCTSVCYYVLLYIIMYAMYGYEYCTIKHTVSTIHRIPFLYFNLEFGGPREILDFRFCSDNLLNHDMTNRDRDLLLILINCPCFQDGAG